LGWGFCRACGWDRRAVAAVVLALLAEKAVDTKQLMLKIER